MKKAYDIFDKVTKKWVCSGYRTPVAVEIYNDLLYQEVTTIPVYKEPVYKEPELEDGWYLVRAGDGETVVRLKKGVRGMCRNGLFRNYWTYYTVFAKLNDIEWLDNQEGEQE